MFTIYVNELVADIVPLYLERQQIECQEMMLAVKTKNWNAVKFISHNILATAQPYGFRQLAILAAELNGEMGKALLNGYRIARKIEEMQAYLGMVKIVYPKTKKIG